MASSENTSVGLAKQVDKATINSTDNAFKYFMFNQGGMAPNNQYIPADDGIGAGSLTPDVDKGGVFSAGAFQFVPRPTILGDFLTGVLGAAAEPVEGFGGAVTAKKHVIGFAADEFSVPYYTFRASPGGLWGETFKACRIASLALNWRAADRVRAQMAVIGGTPTPSVNTATWSPEPDTKPGFLAPTTSISGFSYANLKVMRGSVVFGNNIPLDEQWITGSYEPDDFDLVTRQIVVSLLIKVVDETLYKKMTYDAAGGSAWTAALLKDASLTIDFKSAQMIEGTQPYQLTIEANGSATSPNIAWTVQPIGLQSGRIVTMLATGTFLKSVDGDPVTVTLYNDYAAQY